MSGTDGAEACLGSMVSKKLCCVFRTPRVSYGLEHA